MKDNLLLTGTIGIADIPFITNYEEVKKRLSIRLNNKERLLTSRPGAVYEPFLDFAVTCHIDVSDLRKLNEQRDALLAREMKTRNFTAAIQEDAESVRPAYDYRTTQDALAEVEGKIRRLKHTLNCFNTSCVIPGFDLTIDQMLVYIPQLTARKKKLDIMRGRIPKERVRESFGRGTSVIE